MTREMEEAFERVAMLSPAKRTPTKVNRLKLAYRAFFDQKHQFQSFVNTVGEEAANSHVDSAVHTVLTPHCEQTCTKCRLQVSV